MKTPRVGSAVLAVIRANSPTVGKRPVGRHPDATILAGGLLVDWEPTSPWLQDLATGPAVNLRTFRRVITRPYDITNSVPVDLNCRPDVA